MRDLALAASARLPRAPRPLERPRGLHGGEQEVRPAPRREVLGELVEETDRDARPVGTSVQREPIAGVRIRRPRGRGQVRRVRQHAIEARQPAGEVGADHLDRETLRERPPAQPGERGPIAVGRDDAGAPSRGEQGRLPRARSDLQHALPRSGPGERQQERGVLARRVDSLGRRPHGAVLHASRIACESDARGNHLNISGPRTSH